MPVCSFVCVETSFLSHKITDSLCKRAKKRLSPASLSLAFWMTASLTALLIRQSCSNDWAFISKPKLIASIAGKMEFTSKLNRKLGFSWEAIGSGGTRQGVCLGEVLFSFSCLEKDEKVITLPWLLHLLAELENHAPLRGEGRWGEGLVFVLQGTFSTTNTTWQDDGLGGYKVWVGGCAEVCRALSPMYLRHIYRLCIWHGIHLLSLDICNAGVDDMGG